MKRAWLFLLIPLSSAAGDFKTVDIKIGTGRVVEKGRGVLIHYVARVDGGGVIFSSRTDPGIPFGFLVGQKDPPVIPGLDKGIVGMREGGVRKITVPPALAYGPTGDASGEIGSKPLELEVEVLGVKDVKRAGRSSGE